MSGPDLIDEKFDDLVAELRAAEVAASPELRERVRAIVERVPEPPLTAGRLRARWGGARPSRRIGLVLVPVACVLAAAVGVGVFTSGSPHTQAGAAETSTALVPTQHAYDRVQRAAGLGTVQPLPASANGSAKTAPAPSGSRAQIYSVDLSLRVNDLSAMTKQAINETRGWGGYVVTVDYGSGQKSGTAYLVLRIPIVKVQTAVAELSALGQILDDHVSIQDVQGQLNKRFSQMQALKVTIAKLRANLSETTLTMSQRAFFEAALAQRQARLANLEQQQTAEKTRASFSTVSLDLQTKKPAVVVPSKPGRIGQALHNIGRVLVTEAEILLYVLLIGAPFAVLAALLWASRRTFRRRAEEQLLAR